MSEVIPSPDLFLEDRPLIDVRAPIEFVKGSLPAATNLPLLTDDERHQVGVSYKEEGQAAAINLGNRLVSGDIKAERIERWKAFIEANTNPALFCFRGGLRSKTSQQWLAEHGVDIPIVRGGYKAMRRFLIDETEAVLGNLSVIVLAGRTGSAKTALLKRITDEVGSGCIDLEGLANHRGSAFGKRIEAQPSQIDFEHRIAVDLIRHARSSSETLIIEDESRLIGRCALPLTLQQIIQKSPIVMIEATLEERVNHSWENYILSNYQSHCRVATSSEAGFESFANSLRESLSNISKRLGGKRYKDLSTKLECAISAHQHGDNNQHKAWIEELLRDYYDPMYDYQQTVKTRDTLFRGSFTETLDFLINR